MRSTSIDRPSDAFASTLFDSAKADIQTFAHSPGLNSAAAAAFNVSGATLADAIDSFVRTGWPRLEVVDQDVLGVARGAYDSAHNTIYLSSQFLGSAGDAAVTSVLIEEIGHAIDARVNATDSAGDEGEIFARYVSGNAPTIDELAALHAQNDHGAIFIDGGTVEVEFASTSTNGAKVAIVFSQTSQTRYFNDMAYAQLFMTAQSQATMAGVPFDIISDSDLTNVALLTQYDALVFPNFDAVPSGQASAIHAALLQAEQAGVGIIASSEFMTVNGGNTNSLSTLLGVTQGSGSGQWANSSITVKAYVPPPGVQVDPMMADYTSGEVIRTYAGEWHQTYIASGSTLTPLATQTFANGNTYNAVVTTTKYGATVVHFSTESMLGDNNLLWQAIDKVVNNPATPTTVTAALQMSRGTSLVASRVDMDQAMNPSDVSPGDRPGIYDKLVPILENWKTTYNYVASYYVDIGNNPPNQTTNWAVSGQYYKQILALGNELGSHSVSHPGEVDNLTTTQIRDEFRDSKTIIEQQMSAILGTPFTVEGAAVPGNPEDFDTALDILQYYRYLSGGASTLGAGYPGAIGYLNPAMAAADKVYIAPNVEFDFSLVEFQHMTPAQASAAWLAQWNQLTAHSDVPVIVWPWHDYAASEWSYNGTTPSLYTTQMFTDFIARAFNAGAEFVTLADLADRVSAFDDSSLSWTRNSATQVTATVTSIDAGKFVVDLDNLAAGQKIASVANWYAYDSDSVFLDRDGGTFTINLGNTQTNVTHITALPMRSELVSLSGDGNNLTFRLIGEGDVTLDLASLTGKVVMVSGATVQSRVGEILVLDLGANGDHTVTVTLAPSGVAPDVNGDGTTDVLWHNIDGRTDVWQISGGSLAASASLNAVAPTWRIVDAHGDYNGDGKSDLLWRNVDGRTDVWLMNGTHVLSSASLGSVPSDWRILTGHADFNSDGRSDILWRNADGRNEIWQMNGLQREAVLSLPSVAAGWNIVAAAGDYNGDGRTDLMWQNLDGRVQLWEMNGSQIVAAPLFGAVPSDWRMVDAIGDYNGDNRSDILWQNVDGRLQVWQIDGTSMSVGLSTYVPGGWSVVSAHGDYNGDGRSDLLWRNQDGRVDIWTINGSSILGSASLGSVPAGWTLISADSDYTGDGRSDILWRATDGALRLWQMNGTQAVATRTFGAVPGDWQVTDPIDLGALLDASSAANTLSGSSNRDTIYGGLGNDTLTGGAGADRFVFDTAPNAATNRDTITDFTPGSDVLVLSDVIFSSIPRGPLAAANFVAAATPTAADANDFILYSTTTGALSYDPDGSGAAAAVQFATLLNHPLLTAQDIYVGL